MKKNKLPIIIIIGFIVVLVLYVINNGMKDKVGTYSNKESELQNFLNNQTYTEKTVNVLYVDFAFDITKDFYKDEKYKTIEGMNYSVKENGNGGHAIDVLTEFNKHVKTNCNIYLYQVDDYFYDEAKKQVTLLSILDTVKERNIDLVLAPIRIDLLDASDDPYSIMAHDMLYEVKEQFDVLAPTYICSVGQVNSKPNEYQIPSLLGDSVMTINCCNGDGTIFKNSNYNLVDYTVPISSTSLGVGYFGAIYANMINLYGQEQARAELDKRVIETPKEDEKYYGKGIISLTQFLSEDIKSGKKE